MPRVKEMKKKEKDEIVGMLHGVPLFSNLKKRHLKSIADSGFVQSFRTGDTIVKKGDTGSAFYVVLSGSAQARKGTRVLTELGQGQFFGEMAVLDGGPRSADVIATGDTKCFSLSFWDFHGIRIHESEITEVIIKELVRRLREKVEMLTD